MRLESWNEARVLGMRLESPRNEARVLGMRLESWE